MINQLTNPDYLKKLVCMYVCMYVCLFVFSYLQEVDSLRHNWESPSPACLPHDPLSESTARISVVISVLESTTGNRRFLSFAFINETYIKLCVKLKPSFVYSQ